MGAFVLTRLLWMIPTLIGISLVTFLLMELAPGSAVLAAVERPDAASAGDAAVRRERVQRLMERHGLVDPETGEKLPFLVRYGRWLRHAAVLDFTGSPADAERFRSRIANALPVTMLLNALALLLAFAVAIPLGAAAGMRTGSTLDRLGSGIAFLVFGLPDFLFATLLVLASGVVGLRSDDAAGFGPFGQALDLASHLALPVLTLALGYGVVVFRFLRESVARTAQSDFATALRGLGAQPATIRARVLRNGLSPVVTLLGTMLPTLVSGTVVVESVFSLPGLGWLTANAASQRDLAMVMALTMLVSVVTLVSLLLSDLLQRVIDPRVELR